jgi:ADP-ribose pyrophosphatase
MDILDREVAFEGKYLRFVRKHCRKGSREYVWETLERNNVYGEGAVVVVALTGERELVLERNWRAALESYVVQFPAGLTDKEGESKEEAARRELLEETGYEAVELIPIVSVPLCPVLTATRATHFFAPGVRFVGRQRRDTAEEIEVVKVPVAEVDDYLLNLPDDTALDLRVPGILWTLERKGLLRRG